MQQETPQMDYDHFLARPIKVIKASTTIAINDKATKLRAPGGHFFFLNELSLRTH